MFLKGRVSIIELIDRPFREIHELYRISINKAEARMEAEAAKKENDEKSTDDKQTKTVQPSTPSIYEAEAIEDALEEMLEGGI